jgi:hypothetical protein
MTSAGQTPESQDRRGLRGIGRSHRIALFTGPTWDESHVAGAAARGFGRSRWATVKKIAARDGLLCHVTGLSHWIGVIEVTGKPSVGEERIWNGDVFPAWLPVRVVVMVKPEHVVPVTHLRAKLWTAVRASIRASSR